ncbi:PTS sugar transporter subunit IIA [Alkalibacter saccharofermentans]|uniref:PTS system, galactitol-specific IIA component n=1 Tax=Alkalibacter saccharofermentans DSM 14828 TaxID=1120975 RepID=A0A1M4U261_9FIRM|nr:PTS sugar transporter subunit IIA [Alkalibacter saccharofermentans]SHE50788.1 PTS system, galactitol-specific IIA component [Alkalibacter saccharofermentans DSM 14828]
MTVYGEATKEVISQMAVHKENKEKVHNMSGENSLEILCMFSKALDKYELIKQMSKMLTDRKMVDKNYGEFVIEREEMFPTGIFCQPVSIAIPHSEKGEIYHSSIVVTKLLKPIAFKRMDCPQEDVEVKIVVMLAVNRNEEQLKMLVKLMKIVQNSELMNKLSNSKDCQELEKLIRDELNKSDEEE